MQPIPIYEVRQNNKGQWILYRIGEGDFEVVGIFPCMEDAAFVCEMFTLRDKYCH